MVIAVMAWLRSRVRPGSQETAQPPPVAVAVCGVAGLLMLVSVIVMPLTSHTARLGTAAGRRYPVQPAVALG